MLAHSFPTISFIIPRQAIIPATPNEYPDELCADLWEKYSKAKGKAERQAIKSEHNDLAKTLNNQYKRKVYLLIK